jgi:hypothetical protein
MRIESAVEDVIDLETTEEIQHDLHEKHWPVRILFYSIELRLG